jgi:hypothetical protein
MSGEQKAREVVVSGVCAQSEADADVQRGSRWATCHRQRTRGVVGWTMMLEGACKRGVGDSSAVNMAGVGLAMQKVGVVSTWEMMVVGGDEHVDVSERRHVDVVAMPMWWLCPRGRGVDVVGGGHINGAPSLMLVVMFAWMWKVFGLSTWRPRRGGGLVKVVASLRWWPRRCGRCWPYRRGTHVNMVAVGRINVDSDEHVDVGGGRLVNVAASSTWHP